MRIVTYKTENNLLDKVFYAPNDSDLTEVISTELYGSVMNCWELFKNLNSSGISVFVDKDFTGDEKVGQDYAEEFVYELNVVPNSLSEERIYRLRFNTSEFDDEEMENFLNIPYIRTIYDSDDELRKLLDQVSLLDQGWDIPLRYLTRVYGISFTIINYYINEEES